MLLYVVDYFPHSSRIKYQGPDFDRLTVRSALWTRSVQKGRVRRQPRLILVGIKALDQRDLLWRLIRQEVPLMFGVISHLLNCQHDVLKTCDNMLTEKVAPSRVG